MVASVYRFTFAAGVELRDVRDVLHLAIIAAEGVHGRAQLRLNAGYLLDESERACIVDATTEAGQTVAQIFTALLEREFGADGYAVERVGGVGMTPGTP